MVAVEGALKQEGMMGTKVEEGIAVGIITILSSLTSTSSSSSLLYFLLFRLRRWAISLVTTLSLTFCLSYLCQCWIWIFAANWSSRDVFPPAAKWCLISLARKRDLTSYDSVCGQDNCTILNWTTLLSSSMVICAQLILCGGWGARSVV